MLKGGRGKENIDRKSHNFRIGKGGLAAGNKRFRKAYILCFIKGYRLIKKLFHNITLAVGSAVVVVCSLNIRGVPYSGIGNRLNAVQVLKPRLFDKIF